MFPVTDENFSCASNMRSFQAMYLKFAENVDILVQIVYAKFFNEKVAKMKNLFYF